MADKEKRLLKQAQKGDRSAFGMLVRKYRLKVLYLAFDMVGDYDAAQDIAQDAFIRAYTRLDQYEERASFSTWLYRITVNLALDYLRKQKKKRQDSIETHEYELDQKSMQTRFAGSDPAELVEQSELREILQAGLETLTENQRTATVLKYFNQMSSKEIADIMGCAEGTVRIHIHRALQNLKKQIKM